MSSNITEQDLKSIVNAYYQWKNLNSGLAEFASRTVNFPEAISEALICYKLGYTWHNKANTKDSGDAHDQDGNLIEIKATSNFYDDLTSFSPDTKFDILIFGRLDKENDILYIYNLSMNFEQFQKLQVNSTQTIFDQQQSNRRPRLHIIKQIITPQNLEPVALVNIRELAMYFDGL